MKRNLIAAAIATLSSIAPAYAGHDEADGPTAAGRVETVMVKEARGFFIEKKLLRKAEDKEQWVEVRFPATYLNGPNTDLFQVPASATLERGDIVVAEVADQSPRIFNLIAGENQVTSLVARHDTLYAMLFNMNIDSARGTSKLSNGTSGFATVAFNPLAVH